MGKNTNRGKLTTQKTKKVAEESKNQRESVKARIKGPKSEKQRNTGPKKRGGEKDKKGPQGNGQVVRPKEKRTSLGDK